MSDDDPRNRRHSPSAGAPPRTPTPSNEQLQAEIGKLRQLLQKPDLERRIERVEHVANNDLLKFVRETGARYTEVTIGLARLSAKFEAMTEAMGGWRSEIREQLGDHDDRIAAVEDRSTRNHVRLDTLDDQQLDGRLRAVEQHAASTTATLALTKRQKGGVALLGTAGGGLIALLSRLLGG